MFTFYNVNNAFQHLVTFFQQKGMGPIQVVEAESRNGKVFRIPIPVVITYTNPLERVLLIKARDANPFFHLFESIWMLTGSRDLEPLLYFNSRMKEFSDDGKVLKGAYGYRWKRQFHFNQLDTVARTLQADKGTRRAVVSMWDTDFDANHCHPQFKDVPCNLMCLFEIDGEDRLNLTVYNRSNDLIWGCLGANYVTFSTLLEYMASWIGRKVGSYHQVSNNLHVYDWNWKPDTWLEPYGLIHGIDWYRNVADWRIPLIADGESRAQFESDCYRCVEYYSRTDQEYKTIFFNTVVRPMFQAFALYKSDNGLAKLDKAINFIGNNVQALDWRLAGIQWIENRIDLRRDKLGTVPAEVATSLEGKSVLES